MLIFSISDGLVESVAAPVLRFFQAYANIPHAEIMGVLTCTYRYVSKPTDTYFDLL